jgi:hypothetical protein
MTSKAERIAPPTSTPAAPRGTLLRMSKSHAALATPLLENPVLAALQAPVVQTMDRERRALLEEDLRAMAASGVPDLLVREAIEERLRQEAEIDAAGPMTEEEEAAIEQMIAETDEDYRAGRCIPVEVVLAELGIPWAARTG